MNRSNPIVDFAAKGYESRGKRIFAPKVGEVPSLVAGSSRSILSPTALEELFLYQRTANGAGGTGAAVFQSIKGNSIVWNQLVQNGNFASGTTGWNITGTASVADNELSVTIGSNGNCACVQAIPCVAGHKYLVRFSARATASVNANLNDLDVQTESVALTTTRATFAYLVTPSTSGNKNFNLFTYNQTASAGEKVYIKDVNVIDITLSTMSVTSVADSTKFYGLPYYAPNPGAIKNNCATGMVTDGFNQWDEVYENGYINNSGEPQNGADSIRSKNFCPCIAGATYYSKAFTGGKICFYDANKTFISFSYASSQTLTAPSNAAYFKISAYQYGTTYNHDICINLSWSGYRNGEFEPHWSETTALPITTATGKLNGEGESVVITPNGLAGVGTSFDEAIVEKGMWTKTKKRFEEVDMGTLAVEYQTGVGGAYPRFRLTLSDMGGARNILCEKYPAVSYDTFIAAGADKTICSLVASGYVYVKDSAYTDADTFKAAMDGVMLEYELATPEEYILDTPVPVVARVDENGTQTILPQGVDGSGVPMTAPFAASIFYPEQMDKVYLTAADFKNFLDAAVSGGAITAYTMEWNAATGSYDFTVNQAAATLAAPASSE